MNTYRFTVFEWWESEINPGGMYYGFVRARNQKEARELALVQSGFANDERAVKVVTHAWRDRTMARTDLSFLMKFKK